MPKVKRAHGKFRQQQEQPKVLRSGGYSAVATGNSKSMTLSGYPSQDNQEQIESNTTGNVKQIVELVSSAANEKSNQTIKSTVEGAVHPDDDGVTKATSETPGPQLDKKDQMSQSKKSKQRSQVDDDDRDEPDQSASQQLSRGQRKRLAKREQYMQKERLILSSLKLKHEEEQKKRIDGLDAIRDALLATVYPKDKQQAKQQQTKNDVDADTNSTTANKKPNLLKSVKSQQLLLQREVNQMNLVLQHPSFQADPLATMRQHLQNTLASDVEQQKKQAIQHVQQRQEKSDLKRVQKKEHGIKKKKSRFRATRSKSRK